MQYIKVVNGSVTGHKDALPSSHTMPNGHVIKNLATLTAQELIGLGYYPIVDSSPAIDPRFNSYTGVTYNVNEDHVSMVKTHTETPLDVYKEQKIAAAYSSAKSELDKLTDSYGDIEVASWSPVQDGIMQYKNDGTISEALQAATDASAYTVQQIVDLLYPRIQMQNDIIAERAVAVTAIKSAVSHIDIV